MKKLFTLLFPLLLLVVGICSCSKPRPKAAVLEISGPPGMCSETAGQEFKGQNLKLALSPGRYMFRFTAPGCRDQFKLIEMKPGRKEQVKIEFRPATAAAVISSEPEGAEVTFKGKVIGITPLVIPGLPAGDYSADLFLKGHARTQVTWRIANERPVAAKGYLDSNVGTVTITSTPDQASVFIDGREVGNTPLALTKTEGSYTVRVESDGCIPVERTVRVVKQKKNRAHFKLAQRPGGIQVTSKPAGADVFINSEKRGVTPCTVEALEPGKYTLRLEKAGYDPLEASIKIVPGAVDKKNYNLLSSTGSVVFNVSPAGVEVMLDGRALGVSRPISEGAVSTKDFRVDHLAPGNHVLTLFHALGRPQRSRREFTVTKNQCTPLKNIQIWVANCEIIYTDGTRERGALYSEEKDHVIFGSMPGIRFRIDRERIRTIRMLDSKGDSSGDDANK